MSAADTSVTVHHLDDGWVVHVAGAVEEEIGYNGGHTGGGRHFFRDAEMTDDELRAVMNTLRAEDLDRLSRPRPFHLRVVRDDVSVTVVDEQRLPSAGVGCLLWPPLVTSVGLVVRWERTTTIAEHQEEGRAVQPGEAPLFSDTEVQRAWLVTLTGEVRQLPFELAVRPLAASADGQLLLPNGDPLWWDGDDEPLTWLAFDGTAEPLVIDGEPVRPSRICAAIGEAWANGVEDAEDAPVWEPVQGRRAGDELTVRLLTDTDDGLRWVDVALPLAGSWHARVVGRGEGSDEDPLPPL